MIFTFGVTILRWAIGAASSVVTTGVFSRLWARLMVRKSGSNGRVLSVFLIVFKRILDGFHGFWRLLGLFESPRPVAEEERYNASFQRAVATKDRLLSYDRDAKRRTKALSRP